MNFAQKMKGAVDELHPGATIALPKSSKRYIGTWSVSGGPSIPEEQARTLERRLASLSKELSGERLRHSFAGRLGQLIEPLIKPLGFDWKIGIGIVSSFAAREVFV